MIVNYDAALLIRDPDRTNAHAVGDAGHPSKVVDLVRPPCIASTTTYFVPAGMEKKHGVH